MMKPVHVLPVRAWVVVALLALWAFPTGAQTIVLEAEDAVSTNFAAEAVQLFGAGQNRVLQLNQPTLLNDAPFYADFVVFADQGGEYVLWYGGSLPGAVDPFLPSYGSPFELRINEAEPLPVTYESVHSGPVYSTPYRWIRVGAVRLDQGQNRLRISVDQRRRYDSRYFLYLDNLYFVPVSTNDARLPADELLSGEPESIEDLLIVLRDQPDNLAAYIRLAHLYTLVGDHINALRYLSRAQLLEPRNPEILQLVARNTIWRGDLDGGLGAYWGLLSAAPQQIEGFLEAGKLAAWSGFLGASEQYYLAAFAHFPSDPRLLVNLGFTYLWWNREARARELFAQAERAATTIEDVLVIGVEYRNNQDLGREEALYRTAIVRFPDSLPLAEQLIDVLYAQGRSDAARAIQPELLARLPDTDAATAGFERIARRYTLRDELIATYEARVAADSDNITLRSELAQTYFWIGRREAGIRTFESLLALQTQQALARTWSDHQDTLWKSLYAAMNQTLLRATLSTVSANSAALNTAIQQYNRLAAREGQDLSAPQANIANLTGAIERALEVAELSRSLYDLAVSAQMETARESLATRTEELDIIRTRLNWTPPVRLLAAELDAAFDVLGAGLTRWSLRTLLTPEQETQTAPAVAGSGAETNLGTLAALMAAVAAKVDGPNLVRRWLEIETLSGESAALTDIVVFGELFGEALRGIPGVVGDDKQPAAAAAESFAVFDLERAAAARLSLQEALGPVAVAIREMGEDALLLRRLAALETTLAIFRIQTDTASQRNRLGQLYVDANMIARAVEQLELVRGVDPTNLDTLYSLALAYQQEGRWRLAQRTFAEIDGFDSAFRNTVALHNQLARQHADVFHANTTIVNEARRSDLRTSLDYLWKIDSRLSIHANLQTTAARLRVPAAGLNRRHSYQTYLFSVGVPVSFLGDRLGFEPFGGVFLQGNQLYYATLSDVSSLPVWESADFLLNFQLEPEAGLRWRLGGREFFHDGSYRFGVYRPTTDVPVAFATNNESTRETEVFSRPVYRAHAVAANLSLNFAQRPQPFLARYSQRTGASLDLIQRSGAFDGARYSIEQEFRLVALKQAQPFTVLAVSPTIGFEDFVPFQDAPAENRRWYYRPTRVLQTGGRLDWQLYRPTKNGLVWGFSGSAYGGFYQSALGEPGSKPAFRGAGVLAGELTRNNVAFQLAITGSRVFGFDPAAPDYYNVGVGLTVVARNFQLLTR